MSRPRNPNDLIRIEDAIKVLCRKTCHPGIACPDIYCKEMWDEFEDVERVDAVPVVRCKDCRCWQKSSLFSGHMVCRYVVDCSVVRREDDFCSRGERKEGDHHEG